MPYTRFWANCQLSDATLSRISFDPSGCWLWVGRVTGRGYGSWHRSGHPALAHRYVYEEVVGAIPPGLTLDHLCGVPLCVNPDHLEPVTIQENLARRDNAYLTRRWAEHRLTLTHCPKGHEFSDANTYLRPDGARICRECRLASQRVAKANAKARRAERQKGMGPTNDS